MAKRPYDIVIFGATGYTGEHVARSVQRMVDDGSWPNVRWAVAGRSQSKLSTVVRKHGLKPSGVVIADTGDPSSLRAMAASTTILLNATGPYRFFGEPVVEACIAEGAHYTDLCGEPEFIDRMQLHYGERAAAAGVIIVHGCAFDSVPADIGTIFTALQFPPPACCAQAMMYHTFHVGAGASGAMGHATTFYAAVHGFAGIDATRAQRKQLAEKLEREAPGSSKGPAPLGPKLRVPRGPVWVEQLQKYSFLFPGADAAIVRTSQRHLAMLAVDAAPSAPYL
jgi:short subunit dehydrogenase-like uncharacterized protein